MRNFAPGRFECDAENVAIDWVKLSEDGSGVTVRAYEFAGQGASAAITPNRALKVGKPVICDLMENGAASAGERIEFGGYEIITLKFPFEH